MSNNNGAFKHATKNIIKEMADNWAKHWGGWEGYLPPGNVEFKSPYHGISVETDPVVKGCDHQWINVGFHFEKLVCKKCDCEKK